MQDILKAAVGKMAVVGLRGPYLLVGVDKGAPTLALVAPQDRAGNPTGPAQPMQMPFLTGEIIEYNGGIFLKVDDEATKSGRKILIGLNHDMVGSVSLVSDRKEDEPSRILRA